MRQVTVASYAVGTHTAAGGLERMDRRLHSQDRQQACSVLTVGTLDLHSSTSSLQESCLACTSFPLEGWKRVPTVPDDQADSRWLSQETTTAKTRRTELPGRPHLISHGAAHYLCKVQPPKGSKARVNGRLQLVLEDENSLMWHPVSSPFRPATDDKTGGEREGAGMEWKQPRRHPSF